MLLKINHGYLTTENGCHHLMEQKENTPGGSVLISAGVYAVYSKWINIEIAFVKKELGFP